MEGGNTEDIRPTGMQQQNPVDVALSLALHQEGPGGSRWDVRLSLLTWKNDSCLEGAWWQNRANGSEVGMFGQEGGWVSFNGEIMIRSLTGVPFPPLTPFIFHLL